MGIIGREVAFSVKASYVKPNDLKFLLNVKCSDTREQPFRRMEITSQFLVSEVPVHVVFVLVLWGVVPEGFFFFVGVDQRVAFHSLWDVRDDVLNYCTCEFQEVRQLPFLS